MCESRGEEKTDILEVVLRVPPNKIPEIAEKIIGETKRERRENGR
jgi:hypothetical protein